MTIITNYDMTRKSRVYPCSAGWKAEMYQEHICPDTCTLVDETIDGRTFRTMLEAETWARGICLQQANRSTHPLIEKVNKFRQVAEDIANDFALPAESADHITETLLKRFC